MPINGATRMLRARRKDINVKPNRRLDRKSSRGMLFENEELRMRTITINAEVEQGQHALKKLRRENEQLRREMWSLRDEYDKMERLLRRKETDDDSDQENSDSDDNYSPTDWEDEKKGVKESGSKDSHSTENTESIQTAKFGNQTTARAFDGLSVIDEQTEETTQTTESAIGYGTTSRGNSVNRNLSHATPVGMRTYDDHPCGNEFTPFFDSAYHPRLGARKKTVSTFENDSAFMTYGMDWPDNGYDVRPASPYPYPESIQPSYQKRFEVLQNLPPMVSHLPATCVDENGWMFPASDKSNYEAFPREERTFIGGPFLPDKSDTNPISIQIPQEMDYSVIQVKAGPDVFISDVCAEKKVVESVVKDDGGKGGEADDRIIENVEAEIDKIEISGKSVGIAKNDTSQSAETLKKSKGIHEDKLITVKSVGKEDVNNHGSVDDSVSCQNPSQKDVLHTFDNVDMATDDKASKFQSKLMVTLKTPTVKSDTRTLKRVPPIQVPRSFQTMGYGVKPEYQTVNKRLVGCMECRYAETNMNDRLSNDVMTNVTTSVLTTIGNMNGGAFNSADIPIQHEQDGLGLVTDPETAQPISVSPQKSIKIPPQPPPRTSSCLRTIIPDPLVGLTHIPHSTFRRGKSPVQNNRDEPIEHHPNTFDNNPLMLSEPVATSSPAISPKVFQRSHNLSLDNLSVHHKLAGMAAYDESSAEDISTRRTRTTGRCGRQDPPPLNKSVSSPSFGTFLRRKPSEYSVSSMENGTSLSQQTMGKVTRGGNPQNNMSISSSSGLDSPTKSDRRKRKVSIKFNKKIHQGEGIEPGETSGKHRGKGKNRHEETDITTSERERTNSISSRGSSVAVGSGRRKLSTSSNRTFVHDEKIPWCGCWGNGCV